MRKERRRFGFRAQAYDGSGVIELAAIRNGFENRIEELVTDGDGGDLLTMAMRAAALSAGKRMRPLLLMMIARDLGCTSPALVDIACAVEMVHASSLVLDDMPCMDNAKLRRGVPAIHVTYGQDVAILASVSLLSRAFGILATAQGIAPVVRTQLVTALSEAVGPRGLSKGQYQDLHGGTARSVEDIARTNDLKTGALLSVVVDMAAIMAQSEPCVAQSLRAFACAAGQAFQIRDDLLDLPCNDSAMTGKDVGQDMGKATLLTTLGLDEVRRQLSHHLYSADQHLAQAVGARQDTRRFLGNLFADGWSIFRRNPELHIGTYSSHVSAGRH